MKPNAKSGIAPKLGERMPAMLLSQLSESDRDDTWVKMVEKLQQAI